MGGITNGDVLSSELRAKLDEFARSLKTQPPVDEILTRLRWMRLELVPSIADPLTNADKYLNEAIMTAAKHVKNSNPWYARFLRSLLPSRDPVERASE